MEVTVSIPDNLTQIGTVTAVVNVMTDATADQGAAGEAAAACEAAAAGAVESATGTTDSANS